jgi:hypothetical protein
VLDPDLSGHRGGDEDAAAWQSAATISDLGELTARWLEGKLRWQPCYRGDRPDPETDELVPVLAAMNRAGFWTEDSQPGVIEEDWCQRAMVSGYCTEATSNAIQAAVLNTDLIVVTVPATLDNRTQIPVSRSGAVESTWAGGNSDPDGQYDDDLSRAAVEAIRAAWHIEVIDPVWGRNDLLWDTVLGGLRDMPERQIADHGQFGDEVPSLPNCRLVPD